jgi:hypothetical protein
MSYRIRRALLIAAVFFSSGQQSYAGEKEIRTLTECREHIGSDPNFARRFVIPPARSCDEKDLYPSRLKIDDTLLGIVLVRASARSNSFVLMLVQPQREPEASGTKTCVDVEPDSTRVMETIVPVSEPCAGRESAAVLYREYRAAVVDDQIIPKEACIMPHEKCVEFGKLSKPAQDAVLAGLEPARAQLHKLRSLAYVR